MDFFASSERKRGVERPVATGRGQPVACEAGGLHREAVAKHLLRLKNQDRNHIQEHLLHVCNIYVLS